MPLLDLMNRVRRFPPLYDASVAIRDFYSLLNATRRGSYSQHGEDIFVANFFAQRTNGFYLDVGASHPFRISNTYLLYRSGWSGVTVEPIPRLGRLHRRWRQRDTLLPVAVGRTAGAIDFFEMTPSVLSTLDGEVAERYIAEGKAVLHRRYRIEVVPINEVLERVTNIAPIDFISIDIEGLDTGVLADFDFSRFRPRLFCVEFDTLAARRKMEASFQCADYKIVAVMGCNLIAAPLN